MQLRVHRSSIVLGPSQRGCAGNRIDWQKKPEFADCGSPTGNFLQMELYPGQVRSCCLLPSFTPLSMAVFSLSDSVHFHISGNFDPIFFRRLFYSKYRQITIMRIRTSGAEKVQFARNRKIVFERFLPLVNS